MRDVVTRSFKKITQNQVMDYQETVNNRRALPLEEYGVNLTQVDLNGPPTDALAYLLQVRLQASEMPLSTVAENRDELVTNRNVSNELDLRLQYFQMSEAFEDPVEVANVLIPLPTNRWRDNFISQFTEHKDVRFIIDKR